MNTKRISWKTKGFLKCITVVYRLEVLVLYKISITFSNYQPSQLRIFGIITRTRRQISLTRFYLNSLQEAGQLVSLFSTDNGTPPVATNELLEQAINLIKSFIFTPQKCLSCVYSAAVYRVTLELCHPFNPFPMCLLISTK